MEEEVKVDETQEKEESYIIDPKQQELDELNDRYKRVLAEFENYKKRSQKERESIYGMITGEVLFTSGSINLYGDMRNRLSAWTNTLRLSIPIRFTICFGSE